jgi:hypothetical protein
MFWFHCGRCGSLFQDSPGHREERLCTHCGADPSLGIAELPDEGAQVPPSAGSHGRHRSGRKHKHSYFMLKLVAGWTLVLVLIVLGARKLFPAADQEARPLPEPAAAATPAQSPEEAALFKNATQECGEMFINFLAAGSPESRSQFVFSPLSTISRMVQFQRLNPVPEIDPATVTLIASGLLRLPGDIAFEARWKAADGKTLETVFRREKDEWRLDWDHFAHYSDYPWPLFLAGTGPDEGEFRLLARERLAVERRQEDTISLMLYAPRFGHPHETGFQSPEFLVSRNSRDGKLLDAAFHQVRSGGRIFGTLPSLDPDDMIRVRLRVRRVEDEDERKYEITAVKACHWLTLDDPGVEPGPPAAEETQQPR